MPKRIPPAAQNASSNTNVGPGALIRAPEPEMDTLDRWAEGYLLHQVTTSERSRVEQRRDIRLFLGFFKLELGDLRRMRWTPRISKSFLEHLQRLVKADGRRHYSDRTLNRIFATLRPWARWIHQLAAFSLGDPMAGIKNIQVAALEIDRALTKQERRALLDAADMLPMLSGRSRDRRRHGQKAPGERPQHKLERPWRDRAIIYTLIETGMRRAAVSRIEIDGADVARGTVKTVEKGGHQHAYAASREGLQAISDYLDHERPDDAKAWPSRALFLPARQIRSNRTGRLTPRSISNIWTEVCAAAGVKGRGCHSARHAVGLHIIEKTGNPAAVQRQLGHRHAATSLQYCRIRSEDLREIMDQR